MEYLSSELEDFPIPESFSEIDVIDMLHGAGNFIDLPMKQIFGSILVQFGQKYGTIFKV